MLGGGERISSSSNGLRLRVGPRHIGIPRRGARAPSDKWTLDQGWDQIRAKVRVEVKVSFRVNISVRVKVRVRAMARIRVRVGLVPSSWCSTKDL